MIPTYERPELFELTLKSALAQTYKKIEILVCDNSRDERTAKLMEKYRGHPLVTYVRNREAKTKAENFMPFERMAKGEYLQWLMDDDILRPQKLTKMVKALQKDPKVKLVTSLRGLIDGEGSYLGQRDVGYTVNGKYGVITGNQMGRYTLMTMRNPIGEPSAVLFRRRDLTNHYWRAESRGYLAISDVAMWLELMEQGDVVVFRVPLSDYRRHKTQEGHQGNVILLSRLEWMRLGTEYYRRRVFLTEPEEYKTLLKVLVTEYETSVSAVYEELSRCSLWPDFVEAIGTARRMLSMEDAELERVLA
ncbi:MAG: glycosyltransferase family 2 protein [Selenomonadaceae bacterium]|nr:glycosyltransferase family 2 protein [Selenomonadaceae bacterium]